GEFRATGASLWMLIKPNMDSPADLDLRRTVLAEVVKSTGGRAALDEGKPQQLLQFAAMLTSQYRVTFRAPNGAASGDLQVKLKKPGGLKVAAAKWPRM